MARLGLDLDGGTNFRSHSVSWYEFHSLKDTWHVLEKVVTATGSSMTIFLQSWRKWASGGDGRTWFDDVSVSGDDGTVIPGNQDPVAVIALNAASGPAPLTVDFDGSGSSDPDGDVLSYSWDSAMITRPPGWPFPIPIVIPALTRPC